MHAPTITVVNPSCARRCRHCSYGAQVATPMPEVERLVRQLLERGHRVHLYDLHVTAASLELFRLTGQFAGPGPGWLNVNCDFEPSAAQLAYLDSLSVSVVLSLHGTRDATHALLSGRPGEHARIVAAVHRLRRDLRRPLGLNCVVHGRNLDELAGMERLARESLAVDFLELINLGFGGRSLEALDAGFALAGEALLTAYRQARRLARGRPGFLKLDAQWGPDFVGFAPERCHLFSTESAGGYCNAGVSHLAVRADTGGVWPCATLVTAPEARVGRCVAGELLLEREPRFDPRALAEPCRGCDKLALCGGGCRAMAASEARRRHGGLDLHAGAEDCLYHALRRGRLRLSGG